VIKPGFILAAALCAGSAAAQLTALTNVTLIDGSGAEPRKDVTILIEKDRILDLGPSSGVPIPSGAVLVNLSGKFVVPGIINAMDTSARTRILSCGSTPSTASPRPPAWRPTPMKWCG